jgi:predicted adenine nucleotide alpha hydrolase (AANH) superfamily ATPase
VKVLLHTCCAPCLIYPLEVLRNEGLEVEAYFYNPNIHPEEEYIKRKTAFLGLANAQSVIAHIPEYAASDYQDAIANTQRPARCRECWGLRLLNTARFAKENNFSAFTSALLVSPYQDIEAIRTIGQKIADGLALRFVYRDFRPGFREAHNKARAFGIYCQKYCGCSYSLEERKEALAAKMK